MIKDLKQLNTLTQDGNLYFNPLKNTVEALIPNRFESVHAADLLELPNHDLLACWFAGSDEGNSDISIALSRLNAGESCWSREEIVTEDTEKSEQNPSLFLAPDQSIWLIYTAQVSKEAGLKEGFNLQYTAQIRCRISRDNGYSWGPAKVLFSRVGSFCRQKIQVLKSGRWIFGNWICFPDDSRNGSDISVFQISDDAGNTWKEVPVPESAGRVHANVLELEPGKLAALFRSRFADAVYIANSDDNGERWSVPRKTVLPNNNSSISAICLKSGAIGLIYNPVSFNVEIGKTVWPYQRCPVEIAISEDGGKTWPYRRIIEQGEGFTGEKNDICNRRYEYPVMMQDESGSIHAAYSYGSRSCIKYVCVDENWVRGL